MSPSAASGRDRRRLRDMDRPSAAKRPTETDESHIRNP